MSQRAGYDLTLLDLLDDRPRYLQSLPQINSLQGKFPPVVATLPVQKPTRPFWQSRNGIITIIVIVVLVIGAVIGGDIGGTLRKTKGATLQSSTSTYVASSTPGIATSPNSPLSITTTASSTSTTQLISSFGSQSGLTPVINTTSLSTPTISPGAS